MQQMKVKKYSGDDELSARMKEAGISISLDVVKASILGRQASSIDRIIGDLMNDVVGATGSPSRAGGFRDEIEALWYRLYGSSAFAVSPHMQIGDPGADRETLIEFVGRQVLAGEYFLRQADFGRIQDFFGDERFAKIYAIFENNLALLREMHKSMLNWGEKDFQDTKSLVERLNRFTRILWDTMVTLKESVKAKKHERGKNKTVIRNIEAQTGQEVRRNDQCPCGSNKKYKHCCGLL